MPPPPSSAGVPITLTREAEIVDERREREPGADRRGGDDVVPARVPDARQRVVTIFDTNQVGIAAMSAKGSS